ncbi:MAG: hypothetical protein U0166_08330 [Acidobacteriota bacterium]
MPEKPMNEPFVKRVTLSSLIALLSTSAAMAALPPLSYPVSSDSREMHAMTLGNIPGSSSICLTIADPTTPQFSGVHLWGQNPSGTFFVQKFVTLPDVYASMPAHIGSSAYHDIFYATAQGTQLSFGVLDGGGGAYDPTGSIIATYPAPIGPPQSSIIAIGNNFNGSPGDDVVILVETARALLFKDDGAGNLNPAYEVVDLPPGIAGSSIVAGDVTGDGLDDILVGSLSNQNIVVMQNTTVGPGPSTFAQLQTVLVAGLQSFMLADLDADGPTKLDLLAIRQSTSSDLLVTLNAGLPTPFGTSPTQIVLVDPNPTALSTSDLLPADGDPDVFVSCRATTSYGTLFELSNDGAGGLAVTGRYYVGTTATTNSAGGSNFVGLHDPQAGSFTVFPMSPSGLNVSPADGIVAGPGPDPSAGATFMFFRSDGTPVTTAQTTAYAAAYGVKVGNGNIDGTENLHARDEVLTGPGPSPSFGPHVRAWTRSGIGLVAVSKVSYFAYGTLKGGVNVQGGDIDGDTSDEILTGAGPSAVFGPHVRGWNYDGVVLSAISKVNFFAYSTLKYGVEVGGGWDGEDDGFDEVLTGPGPGPTFSAQVRGWNYDGSVLTAIGKVDFVAMGAPSGYGCAVVGGDADEDGFDEILAARGPGSAQTAQSRGFNYDGTAVVALPGFDITAFVTVYGCRISEGNFGGDVLDDRDDIIIGEGTDPAAGSNLKTYVYDGTQLLPGAAFAAFSGTAYGVNPSAAYLGF